MLGPRMRLYQLDTPDGLVALAVQGEIDLLSAGLLEQALIELAEGGITRMVLEISQVTFMDSPGINTLLRTHRMTTAAGGWLRLACARSPTSDVIRLTGLDQVIPTYTDFESALSDV